MILAIFDLQDTLILSIKVKVNWPFSSGEAQNRFTSWQSWQPSWIPISTISVIFDLQVVPILPTRFQVNWPFSSEAQNRFSRWWPSWISDLNDFTYFWSTKLLTKFQVNWLFGGFSFHQNHKIDFQDGGHLGFLIGHIGHLWFSIEMILAVFHLQAGPILPTTFRVNWFFHSEEAQNIQDGGHLFDLNNFSYFWSTSHPLLPTMFRVNWPFSSG